MKDDTTKRTEPTPEDKETVSSIAERAPSAVKENKPPEETVPQSAAEQVATPAEPTTPEKTLPAPDGSEQTPSPPSEMPVVVLTPQETRDKVAPASPPPPPATTKAPERAQVHVAPNLLEVATGRAETPTEKQAVKERRDLDQVVHQMLIVGLLISTALMLLGLIEGIVLRQALPTVEPDVNQVLAQVVALSPSGFLALGLLVLIATPILRVLGSILAFAYERDWRFTGITLVVLAIVVASILLGRG